MDQGIDVNLGWVGGDPDEGDTVSYDVYLAANDITPDVLVCDDVATPACDPGTLAYGADYYWYVVATDNHGASTTGPTWDLTTAESGNHAPHTPGSPSPARKRISAFRSRRSNKLSCSKRRICCIPRPSLLMNRI